MQTITTTFSHNNRGARITAVSSSGLRASVAYEHAASDDANHTRAMMKLATRLEWFGVWHIGDCKRGRIYVCENATRTVFVRKPENPLPESPIEAMASTDTE